MNKKKILYVITKSNWGGAQKYVYDLATSLPTDSFDVIVALGGTGALGATTGILKKKLDESNIRTIEIKNFARDIYLFKEIFSLCELLRIIWHERPDIIHVNSSKAGGLGAVAGRILGIKKIVFTAHGWPFNEPRSFIPRMLIIFFSWLTGMFATDIIVIFKKDLEEGMRLPFLKRKLHLVHVGTRAQEMLPRESARDFVRQQSGLPKEVLAQENIWVISISELHRNKGLGYMIEAIAQLPEALRSKILFFVMGEGEERASLLQLIEEKRLTEHVFLLGHVSEASSYLSAFDIFTLTSLKEGLSYALLEAGFAKIAIIATNVGGMPDVIQNEHSGILVPSKSSDAIAKALSEFVTNKEKREMYSNNIYKEVSISFSLETMLEKTIRVYE